MKRIIFPTKSFCAFIDYNEAERLLFITLRNGRHYLYEKVPKGKFALLESSTNKGNYLANNVIKDKDGIFLCIVPMADIEKVIAPKTKWYQNLAR